MSRRRGSATALNASEVVAALAMFSIYAHIGICQALFYQSFRHPFPLLCAPQYGFIPSAGQPGSYQLAGQVSTDKRTIGSFSFFCLVMDERSSVTYAPRRGG